VIGVTEALVAIDVNSGRATKEGSIEETALKTNLEAAEEIARQLRLRDLAGLIVIDFIDMEERKNNAAVEKRLKDKLKTDRARIQVGRISGFGLLEMSRQRLRPGMLESTTQPCPHCHGTGLIRSDDNMALQVLRALEEEGTRKRSREVLLKAPIGIVNFLINQKREHVALIEARYGMSVRIEADPALVSPDYTIEKFKTATRVVPEPGAVISGNASLMGAPVAEDEDEDIVEEIDDEATEAEAAEAEGAEAGPARAAAQGDGAPGKKKRRRRRRRRGGAAGSEADGAAAGASDDDGDAEGEGDDADGADAAADLPAPSDAAEAAPDAGAGAAPEAAAVPEAAAKPQRSRTRSRKPKATEPLAEPDAAPDATPAAPEPVAEAAVAAGPEAAAKPAARSRSRKPKAEPAAAPEPEAAALAEAAPPLLPDPGIAEDAAPALHPDPESAVSTVPTAADSEAEAVAEAGPPKPRRKGWWSLGR
jgi:ribonuclease E